MVIQTEMLGDGENPSLTSGMRATEETNPYRSVEDQPFRPADDPIPEGKADSCRNSSASSLIVRWNVRGTSVRSEPASSGGLALWDGSVARGLYDRC